MADITAESWSWFSVCALSVIARTTSHALLHKSVKRLPPEDYVMFFTFACYLGFLVCLNVAQDLWNKWPDIAWGVEGVPESEYWLVALAGKLTMIADILQVTTVWLVKACMIILYLRLVKHLWQRKVVLALAIYTAVTYIILEVFFLAVWCRPFKDYWSIGVPDEECVSYRKHTIMNLTFSVSSDLVILAILVPVVVRLSLPPKRKIFLYALLGLGVFSIISTILCRALLISDPLAVEWPLWYIREPSTGILCANLPLLWPLGQRLARIYASTMKSFKSGYNRSGDASESGGRSNEVSIKLKSPYGTSGAYSTDPGSTMKDGTLDGFGSSRDAILRVDEVGVSVSTDQGPRKLDNAHLPV